MIQNESTCKPDGLVPLQKKPHFAAYTKLKAEYPGLDFGNRCGHRPAFKKIPTLKKNGKQLKIKHFLRRVEHQAYMLFKQHYKNIFAQCPQIKAAANNKKIRSETREALYIVTALIARNTDLTTMQLARERSASELVRFANNALIHDSRRFSSERLFDAIRLLTDAGLLHYRIPPAVKKGEEWQAASAEIAFTEQFWNLLGISKAERTQQKNKANHALRKNTTSEDIVGQRRMQARMQADQRKQRAIKAKLGLPTEFDQHIASKIRAKLAIQLNSISDAQIAYKNLEELGNQALMRAAKNLGLLN